MALRTRFLIVEDRDQQGAVIGLMRHHISWPDKESEGWPAYIEVGNSATEILDLDFLDAKFKSSGLSVLGIMVDADDKFDVRWARIREFCAPRFKDVPAQLPETGLVVSDDAGRKFGAWIMPDNKSGGMLETFCRHLVPDSATQTWAHAEMSVQEARRRGAPWRDTHREKAHIHTWLAWQDPPGERMGIALTKKILDPTGSLAATFVSWFSSLYG